MKEDANFDLALLADQAVRTGELTPPLSVPDVEHIANHGKSDAEGRPRRTLDFSNLATDSTATNVTEGPVAAINMDIDVGAPTQAAARSSSPDVPSNTRADWLDNGPARVRRAMVAAARVAREMHAEIGDNIPLAPAFSSFDGTASATGHMAGYDVLMPGPHFSVCAADADRSGVAPTTRPRMVIDTTGINVQLHPLSPQGGIALAQGNDDVMMIADAGGMADGDSDVEVDVPDIEPEEPILDHPDEPPPKQPPPLLPPPEPPPPEPDPLL